LSRHESVDLRAISLMVLLCMTWGVQQVFIKALATDMAPVMQMSLRSGAAALLVFALIGCRGGTLYSHDTWRPGIFAGILFAIEFLCIGEGLKYTSASRMVVFLYSTPILTAIALHWKFPEERLNLVQWLGVLTAFAGLVSAFLGNHLYISTKATSQQLLGDFLALLAAISWAATTVLIRSSSLSRAPATLTLWYQLSVCFVVLMVLALLTGQTSFVSSPHLWANLLFQSVAVSFGSLLIWFWLLRRYPASQLGVFTFLTPLFGVLFGVWLLNETLSPAFVVGALLAMAGIVVVNGHRIISVAIRGLFTPASADK